jgi:hypothetical protein
MHLLGVKTGAVDELKQAYRTCCKKYHPDLNPDGLAMMQMVNEAYQMLNDNMGEWGEKTLDQKDVNITEELLAALKKIRSWPGLKLEVCGTWLWVSGLTYNYKNELKENHFKWSKNKQMWYFHPEGYRKLSRRSWDMESIRQRFGSKSVESENNFAIA